MAVIKIKRGGASAVDAPGQLSAGEMAVSYGSPAQNNSGGRLFIGNSDASANIIIGGQYFTSIADHVAGTLTASSALIVDANKKIDDLLVDNLQINANNITSTNTNGHINITPNGTGDVVIDGLKYPQADGSANQFLKTDGSGQLSFGTVTSTFTLAADSGSNDTFNTGETLTFTGTDPIDTTVGDGSITISIDDASTSAKGAASFASADFAVSSGAVTIKTGGVSDGQLAGSISNAKLSNSAVTIGSTSTALGATSTAIAGLTQLTVDQIDINGNTITSSSGDIILSAASDIDANSNVIKNVATPTADSHATNKGYVDGLINGLDVKESVDVATTANLGYTYSNGAGTLTNGSNGVISLDGIELTANMRVLVKDQTDAKQNGIYKVTTAGAVGAALVLTRADDANVAAEFTGGTFTFVEQGSSQAENGYVFSHNGTPTFGTTLLTVSQFSGAGQITAGEGLTKAGNIINVIGGTTIDADTDTIHVNSSGTANQILLSAGTVGNEATYGQLPLGDSNAVAGTLAVANGGSGATTFTDHGILVGSGTGAFTALAAGTSGQFLISGGSGADPSYTSTIDAGTF